MLDKLLDAAIIAAAAIAIVISGCATAEPPASTNIMPHVNSIQREASFIYSTSEREDVKHSAQTIGQEAEQLRGSQEAINKMEKQRDDLEAEKASDQSGIYLWLGIIAAVGVAASVGIGVAASWRLAIPIGAASAALLLLSIIMPTMVWLLKWAIIAAAGLAVLALAYVLWVNRHDLRNAADDIM